MTARDMLPSRLTVWMRRWHYDPVFHAVGHVLQQRGHYHGEGPDEFEWMCVDADACVNAFPGGVLAVRAAMLDTGLHAAGDDMACLAGDLTAVIEVLDAAKPPADHDHITTTPQETRP